MVPQGGRRASGRRGGSGSDAEHLARQSPKNVAQARRFLGAPGPPIGATPPQPAMAAGVARATGGSSAVRTPARYPTKRRPFGPGGSQCRSGKFGRGTGRPPGGAATGPWKERFFSRAACSPPRPTRPRGSTTAGRDRIDALGRRLRQTGDVGWIANEADPGGGGRSRARPAGRLATIHAAKGGTGRPPGGCKRALERTFFTRAACSPPPGDPGPKAVLERPGSPIPCDEGEDLLKGGQSRGISGESGGLALHPRAFSGKESSHPLSGPRPGLVPGCRRGRARRTRSRPSTPCRSVPTTMAKKAAPKAAQGKAAPAPAAKAAQGKAAPAPAAKAATEAAPAPATKAPPKAADTPAPARPKPANRTVVYTASGRDDRAGQEGGRRRLLRPGRTDRQGAGQAGPRSVRRPRTPEAQGGAQARHQGAAGEEPVHRRADDDPGQARPQRRPGVPLKGLKEMV